MQVPETCQLPDSAPRTARARKVHSNKHPMSAPRLYNRWALKLSRENTRPSSPAAFHPIFHITEHHLRSHPPISAVQFTLPYSSPSFIARVAAAALQRPCRRVTAGSPCGSLVAVPRASGWRRLGRFIHVKLGLGMPRLEVNHLLRAVRHSPRVGLERARDLNWWAWKRRRDDADSCSGRVRHSRRRRLHDRHAALAPSSEELDPVAMRRPCLAARAVQCGKGFNVRGVHQQVEAQERGRAQRW